jgi:hypothetical protein
MGEPGIVRARTRHRKLITGAPAAAAAVLVAMAILAASSPVGSATPGTQWSAFDRSVAGASGGMLVPGLVLDTGTDTPASAASAAAATPTRSAGPAARPIVVLTPPPGPKAVGSDPNRPIPLQSKAWLALKASGMIAPVGGKVTTLDPGADPKVMPATGQPIPDARVLNTTWTRWMVEVLGVGHDENGTYYRDLSYWKLCGDGAMTVALWYWQQLTGYPNVTGTEGYFLDPFVAQGAYWPKPGPRVATRGRTKLGTYWSGSDTLNGYLATGRGFEMYLATQAQPAGWKVPGLAIFAKSGKPVYASTGTDRVTIQTGLNWEVSGHDADSYATAFYATVVGADPYFAHDLNSAVMLDVGRDGVPVVAAADSFYLPNWANGAASKHQGHSITIVGYDNTANPPTYSYIDTCGHACNPRSANREGRVYTIPQAQLALAMRYFKGAGFVW